MKRLLVAIMIAAGLWGCSDDTHQSATVEVDSVGAAHEPEDARECVEPENPYNDDGGHDAGFKWAEENGAECNGDSDSFNEGCAEYHRQMQTYETCVAQSKQATDA